VLEFKSKVREAVNIGNRSMIGHVSLHIRKDGSICSAIAEDRYDADQGARSLRSAVISKLEEKLIEKYLEESTTIKDDLSLKITRPI
jgi:ATP-dependent Clp protease ATP-binding subunit ClpA